MRNINEIIHTYPLRLFSFNFIELISKAEIIETEIEADLLHRFQEYVESNNGSFYGKSFKIKSTNYTIDYFLDFHSRIITFNINRVDINDVKSVNKKIEINEFGLIKRIQIKHPEELNLIVEPCINDMSLILKSAYKSLEEAFLTLYLKWRFSLLDQIYAITNTHLKITNCEEMIGRYWFSVSNLKKNTFRYQFDRSSLESAISWFKNHHSNVCGFFAITSLIIEEPEDGVFGADKLETKPIKIDDETFILKIADLPHIQTIVDFAVAEKQLYGVDEMACIDIITLEDISLQLNCPVADYERHQIAIQSATKDIISVFTAQKSRHQDDLREIETALNKIKEKNKGWFKELSLDLTAKVAKELLRSP